MYSPNGHSLMLLKMSRVVDHEKEKPWTVMPRYKR